MTLIARLQNAGAQLPPSHYVDHAAIPQLLGALLAFVEHGDDFLDAAEDPDTGVIGFLTRVAEAENAELAAEQARQQPDAGSVISQPATNTGQAPQPVYPPGFPGGVPPVQAPVPVQSAPIPQTDPMRELLGELLGELQSARAERADRQRTQITVTDPPDEPSEPGPFVPPSSPVSDAPPGETPNGVDREQPAAPADAVPPASPPLPGGERG